MSPSSRPPYHLILVRHGESHSNAAYPRVALPTAEGDRLTDRGKDQARKLAESLRASDPGIVRLLASDMRRAQETAAPISELLGLEIETVAISRELEEGDEFLALGPEEQRLNRWTTWMSGHAGDPTYAPAGSESFAALRERVRDFKEEVVGICAEAGGPVLAVSHGIFMRFFLFDSLLGEGFTPDRTPLMWQIGSRNCGVCTFQHSEPDPSDVAHANGGWRCLSWMEPRWSAR